MKSLIRQALLLLSLAAVSFSKTVSSIRGELKQWHKVTIDFAGPESSEEATPNPFTDYRLDVRFTNGKEEFLVPGYFAADGNAAESGATSGSIWRVHFAPNKTGKWKYQAKFVTGSNVHAGEKGRSAGYFDGLSGEFEVAPTDKTGRDFRAHGRLSYVGKHHLRFEGSGKYFLKAGADAPENFLAYAGFDGDFKSDGKKDNLIKTWEPHVRDWKEGDPSWQGGKGKGIIGAVNYLAGQGLNVFSFLTFNIDGDDCNVFPYTTYDERFRLDCSRLDQWGIVFDHGTKLGMYLHFKTMEAENTLILDKGWVGPERALYYRELIARFGHNLALNWNLGEEVGFKVKVSTEQKKAWANFFLENDPYHHHMVIHNGNRHYELMGDASPLTGFSLQTNQTDFRNVHGETLNYLRRSVAAGKPWVVACDEPGDATHSLIPDKEDPTRNDARKNALWGNFMAGGAGVEWYFGYAHAHSDLTCQDYRVREKMWKQSSIALDFFTGHDIPYWDMVNANDLVSSKEAYCLAKAGELYLVFLKNGQPAQLDLSGASGPFEIHWFNPREGGDLQTGSSLSVVGGQKVMLGSPPANDGNDWLALVRPGDPKRDYPPGVSAGAGQTIMLPRDGSSVVVELLGDARDDFKNGGKLTSKWSKVSGPGKVVFAEASQPKTNVTLYGAGTYELALEASDGKQSSRSMVKVVVEPFQARAIRSVSASESLYFERGKVQNNEYLKVEPGSRTAVIKFDLPKLPPKVLAAKLRLTCSTDGGGGQLKVTRLADPKSGSGIGSTQPVAKGPSIQHEVSLTPGRSVDVPIEKLLGGNGPLVFVIDLAKGGNDIWFHSSSHESGPRLVMTVEDPDGKFQSLESAKKKAGNPNVLNALSDFKFTPSGEFVSGYLDQKQKAMAINAALHRDKFAAAESRYQGESGKYDLVLTTLAETDGESSYRLIIGGREVGEVKNPVTQVDYKAIKHSFKKVEVNKGDTIRVEFNSASNGRIPEGDGFAFSRGRWQSLAILTGATTVARKDAPPFKYTYDVSKAKKIHVQKDGIVVVEAEEFDAVDRQDHRVWHLTTRDKAPGVKPDPDPSHAEGALGRGYLELLPDTRVTHADPLVNGVSFTNVPGQCSVLYYPIEFKEAGRYYVWVRMNCTGSEDNGIHVGLDGKWPASGARMQFTGKHGQWQWDSRQRTEKVHTGVLGQIWLDVDKPGLHTVMFSMREDGFEFDRFLLTREKNAMKSKNSDPGPSASPARK